MDDDLAPAADMCDVCCYEDNEPMGVLGRVAHYRCRACGWQWSQRLEQTENEEA